MSLFFLRRLLPLRCALSFALPLSCLPLSSFPCRSSRVFSSSRFSPLFFSLFLSSPLPSMSTCLAGIPFPPFSPFLKVSPSSPFCPALFLGLSGWRCPCSLQVLPGCGGVALGVRSFRSLSVAGAAVSSGFRPGRPSSAVVPGFCRPSFPGLCLGGHAIGLCRRWRALPLCVRALALFSVFLLFYVCLDYPIPLSPFFPLSPPSPLSPFFPVPPSLSILFSFLTHK